METDIIEHYVVLTMTSGTGCSGTTDYHQTALNDICSSCWKHWLKIKERDILERSDEEFFLSNGVKFMESLMQINTCKTLCDLEETRGVPFET
jgi:hypothetical protein